MSRFIESEDAESNGCLMLVIIVSGIVLAVVMLAI